MPILMAVVLASSVCAVADEEGHSKILADALEKRYETETLQRMTLVVKGPSGNLRERKLELATKLVEDRLYVLGKFTEPPRMRGTAFLAIESKQSSSYFVYLPAFRKVRRISNFQRSDPWFETDLSFEDVERHYYSDYRVLSVSRGMIAGEGVKIIRTTPTYNSRFAEVHFFIATTDLAMLRLEYYVAGRANPSKSIDAPREFMIENDGSILPKRITAKNHDNVTETQVVVGEVIFEPNLTKRFFSTATLEIRNKLPFVAAGTSNE